MDDDVAQYVADLADPRSEGMTKHMYRDSAPAGYVTCGIGVKLDSPDAAIPLAFWNYTAGRMAQREEVAAEFRRVQALAQGHPAGWYRNTGGGSAPIVELLDGEAEAAARRLLEAEFLPALRRVFPAWGSFPLSVRRGLVDVAWNVGIGRDPVGDDRGRGIRAFRNLRAALAATPPDYKLAALASHRVQTTEHARLRNVWAAGMIEAGALPVTT